MNNSIRAVLAVVLLLGIALLVDVKIKVEPIGPLQDFVASPSTIDEYLPKIQNAFNKAEEEILEQKPDEDDENGQHPDPKKCICKGTGKIRAGDGHYFDCKYHGKRSVTIKYQSAEVFGSNENSSKFTTKEELETEIKKAIENIKECNCEDPECAEKENISHQVTIFSSVTCTPCKKMINDLEPALKEIGIELNQRGKGEDSLVRVIKYEEFPEILQEIEPTIKEFYTKYNSKYLRGFPLTVEYTNGELTRVGVGLYKPDRFIEEYNLEKK